MISIIIPTYNRNEILYPILEKIHNELPKELYELIVINDSKTTQVILKDEWTSTMKCLKNPKSGVASARNLGVKNSKFEWLLFLDDDMVLSIENFETYLNWIKKNEPFIVNLDWKYSDETNSELMLSTFGRYLLKIGYNSLRGWNDFPEWGDNEIVKVDSIASCNLLLSKKDFNTINGYDENFPFSGAEDFDFSERLKSLHVPMYIDLSSFTIHNELDHLTFKKWLYRQFRGGITKRIAFEKGYNEQEIKFQTKYRFPIFLNSICLSLFFVTKRFGFLDKFSFKLINAMVGQAIHSGFHNQKISF
jgi:glycosyltransferase involved in cell wall biosynthesis